jgi:2-C-methyl-D-erythritol 4-phosphate cytidylyltransferase
MFSVIITAGGIGKRMGSSIPKQFIEVNGLPILMHTILRFYEFNSTCQIIVTLPSDWIVFWRELIDKHQFKINHLLVDGGIERYDSIKNALSQCESDLIAIHDGVRPFVNLQTIKNCLDLAQSQGSAIPTLPLKESLRNIQKKPSTSVKRSDYVNVQTPQFFKKDIILKAYQMPFHEGITDDASLVEEAGFEIFLCEGNEENIKITSPLDLKIAEILA